MAGCRNCDRRGLRKRLSREANVREIGPAHCAAAGTETRRRDSREMGGEDDSGGQLGHRRTAELYICAYLGTSRAAQVAGKALGCARLQFKSGASLSSV